MDAKTNDWYRHIHLLLKNPNISSLSQEMEQEFVSHMLGTRKIRMLSPWGLVFVDLLKSRHRRNERFLAFHSDARQ